MKMKSKNRSYPLCHIYEVDFFTRIIIYYLFITYLFLIYYLCITYVLLIYYLCITY